MVQCLLKTSTGEPSLHLLQATHAQILAMRLYEGPQTMLAFMWQDDLIGVAKFVNACLQKTNPSEGQTSDQPGVAGRDVM